MNEIDILTDQTDLLKAAIDDIIKETNTPPEYEEIVASNVLLAVRLKKIEEILLQRSIKGA